LRGKGSIAYLAGRVKEEGVFAEKPGVQNVIETRGQTIFFFFWLFLTSLNGSGGTKKGNRSKSPVRYGKKEGERKKKKAGKSAMAGKSGPVAEFDGQGEKGGLHRT